MNQDIDNNISTIESIAGAQSGYHFLLARFLAEFMIKDARKKGVIDEFFSMPLLSILKTQACLMRDKVKRPTLDELLATHGFVYSLVFKGKQDTIITKFLPKSNSFRFHFNKFVEALAMDDLIILQSQQLDKYFLHNGVKYVQDIKCRKEFVLSLACENKLLETEILINGQTRKGFKLKREAFAGKPSFVWDLQRVNKSISQTII